MRDQRGFTLVELIAVLITLAVITTVVAMKFVGFTTSTKEQMIDQAIVELNTREKLVWSNAKLADVHDNIDEYVRKLVERDIGAGATVLDTSITVGGVSADVERTAADRIKPAIWSRP